MVPPIKEGIVRVTFDLSSQRYHSGVSSGCRAALGLAGAPSPPAWCGRAALGARLALSPRCYSHAAALLAAPSMSQQGSRLRFCRETEGSGGPHSVILPSRFAHLQAGLVDAPRTFWAHLLLPAARRAPCSPSVVLLLLPQRAAALQRAKNLSMGRGFLV